MLLADAGHDVLVVDRASFPSDTVSTHVIARTGMVQLNRWGLLDALHDSGAPRLTTVELDTGDDVIVRTIKDRHGVDHLLAPRRIVLDDAPPGRRTPLRGPHRDGGERRRRAAGRRRAGRRRLRPMTPAAASGCTPATSWVPTGWARASPARSGRRSILARPTSGAALYAYLAGDWSGDRVPRRCRRPGRRLPDPRGRGLRLDLHPEEVARRHQRRGAARCRARGPARRADPRLRRPGQPADQTSPVRGMLRMPNHVRQAAGPGWALVGDAGYHRDAITGHGISDAFRDAELLAAALDQALRDPAGEAAALAAYGRDRDRMAARSSTSPASSPPSPTRALRRAAATARRRHRRPGGRARRPTLTRRRCRRVTTDLTRGPAGTPAPHHPEGSTTMTIHGHRHTATASTPRRSSPPSTPSSRCRPPRSSSSAPTTSGSRGRTAGRRSPTSSASARSARTSASSPSTPTTRPSSSGRTTARPRSSSCSTPWRPASPPGLANIAAARGVTLTEVRSTVTGDIDLNGILGLRPVRNGYQQVGVRFVVKGDAPEEVLRAIVEQSRQRSAVYDVITNGVPGRHRGRGRLTGSASPAGLPNFSASL